MNKNLISLGSQEVKSYELERKISQENQLYSIKKHKNNIICYEFDECDTRFAQNNNSNGRRIEIKERIQEKKQN